MMASTTGCATWTHLESKVYTDKKQGFSARLPKDWMRFNQGKEFIITRDGVVLNRISVREFDFNVRLLDTSKMFIESMTPQEIADISIELDRANKNIRHLSILSNQPATISGEPGYRIAYTYKTSSELSIKGIEYGFIHKDKVKVITFTAAQIHYYDSTVGDFEQFIKSFRLQ